PARRSPTTPPNRRVLAARAMPAAAASARSVERAQAQAAREPAPGPANVPARPGTRLARREFLLPPTAPAMSTLHEEIAALEAEIADARLASEDEIEAFRIRTLGRKSGAVTALFGRITEVQPAERGRAGQALNALKQQAEAAIEQAQAALTSGAAAERTDLDLTLPGRVPAPTEPGSLHPLTRTLDELEAIFRHFGF